MDQRADTLVVALGGNALARHGDEHTTAAQYRRAAQAMWAIARLSQSRRRLVLTHGNGPVVGDIVLRGEAARDTIEPSPLYVADADSEGGIGLMLQQTLGNELRRLGSPLVPATIVTQVVVSPDDPAFGHPTKPIGPYFPAETVPMLSSERGWVMAEEPGRGWRRVVPSPRPVRVVEAAAVAALLDAHVVPIAAGGGGVPVTEATDGSLSGIDAVVDKDWTAAVLGRAIGASLLLILMEEDAVYTGYDTQAPVRLGTLDAHEAAAIAPTLPSGSVGPKLAASAWFAEQGGTAIICRAEDLSAALCGDAGTRVAR